MYHHRILSLLIFSSLFFTLALIVAVAVWAVIGKRAPNLFKSGPLSETDTSTTSDENGELDGTSTPMRTLPPRIGDELISQAADFDSMLKHSETYLFPDSPNKDIRETRGDFADISESDPVGKRHLERSTAPIVLDTDTEASVLDSIEDVYE